MDGLIDGQQQGGEKNALLKKWDERVGKAVKAAGKQHALYKKCRDAVDLREKNEARKVNPYLIHSTLSALVPALYAKNPEIEVRPARLAAEVRGEVSPWVAFAEVAEDLLQREFVDNTDLKRRAKGCLLSTLTTGSGWLKMTLQDDYRADPMQYNRLNDAQDNVAEIEALQRELDEPAADEEAVAEALKFQTAHVEAALQGRSVSTHSRPKAAGLILLHACCFYSVSTHSRPKAAGMHLQLFCRYCRFQLTAARRRLA